jgi:hypothetical protein
METEELLTNLWRAYYEAHNAGKHADATQIMTQIEMLKRMEEQEKSRLEQLHQEQMSVYEKVREMKYLEIAGGVALMGGAIEACRNGYWRWCIYRHQKFQYTENQINLRKYLLGIDFSGVTGPAKHRLSTRIFQATFLFMLYKKFMDKYGKNSAK